MPTLRIACRDCGWNAVEDRTLLSVAPALLSFTSFGTAAADHFLASADEFDLYQVHLYAGDRLTVNVSAQSAGSGLQSALRLFDATNGQQLAADFQEGGDPQLTFQAATDGDYWIGVSSAGDDAYNPNVADSGAGGATTGL